MLDLTTPTGRRVAKRLETETVVWLTTVSPDGSPRPSLVWFWWDGQEVLVYSQPGKVKLRNIEARPRVALNFNSDPGGGDVGVLLGAARLDPPAPPVSRHRPYLDKYRLLITDGLDMTVEAFSDSYSVALRVRPDRYRAW
ncbi:MAG: TIGR03667 family PPOX class F420-dependent oxidoreductase [Acidimicrobiia bacterium]